MANDTKSNIFNTLYKKETGNCPACQLPLETHQRCEGCLILCGPKHDYNIERFRRHDLCPQCVYMWGRLEKVNGRAIRWDEFKRPTTSMSGEEKNGD